MAELPPLSLYIHIPWCVQKCPYCDFNSHTLKGAIPQHDYLRHLLADLDADLPWAAEREIRTIFIGGGTPSLLEGDVMQALLDGVRQRIAVSAEAEITLEANPGTVEAARFHAYRKAGVNRLSMGVQSFSADKLQRLGRIHGPDEAVRAFHLAREAGFTRINLDIMHGLPAQSAEEALADLHQAIALGPEHLSWYQLTIEPNTAFGSRPPRLPDEEILWQIFEEGRRTLQAGGYQQYEVSAWSRAGEQCQHNLNYWHFGDYLGIGCGAHGKITLPDGQILRSVKTRHPRGFLQGHYRHTVNPVPADERPFEFFMNQCRLMEAIPKAHFTARTGLPLSAVAAPVGQAVEQGYLSETPTHWQVTERGALFLNSLLTLFLNDD